jgi:predicted flavoprotein YhiN
MQKKLIVIGGGAAGFFCAVNAARLDPLLKVILVEKSSKVLSKVKVSGGEDVMLHMPVLKYLNL